MGKCVGLNGTISGKIGTVVYSKGEKGLSYGRSYQPVVANPKTVGQVDQRSKMNLVGRMSQVTPFEVILGLSGSKRMRRSEFNKMLLSVATIDRTVYGSVVAKIAPRDILFSKGAQALEASVSADGASTATAATIGLTLADASLAGKYGERVVVAVIDPSDKGGYSLVKFADVVFDDTTARTVTINYGAPIADESLVCIYRLPFRLTEQGAAMRTETLVNNGVDIIAKVLLSDNLVRDWGQSELATTVVFTRA